MTATIRDQSMDTMIYTDKDDFISIQIERVLVEFTQDGDSDCYPNSWTYGIWFDGEYIEGTSDEMSYEDAVIAVEDALVRMIDEVDEAIYQMERNNIYHARY